MQEDFKKKFVLLSKVAKEKKYAQEYLGLLARRGDIGSIRIGKRWYTTWGWFFEFEKDIAAKKVEAATPEIETKSVEALFVKKDNTKEKNTVPLQIAKKLPTIDPVRNKFCDSLRLVRKEDSPLGQVRYSRKVSNGVDLRKTAQVRIQKSEKENQETEKEFEIRNEARGFSPSFAPEPVEKLSFLPRFAFGASLMLLLALLFQAGWIYKDDLKRLAHFESGVVAGAYDIKADFSSVKNFSADYLGNKGDRVKENVSFARVVLRAAMERDKEQGPMTSDQ